MAITLNGTSGITTPNSVTELTPSTTTGSYYYWNNGSVNVAGLGGYSDSSTAGHLEIYTTTGSTLTERMRITSAGAVGIGTTAPAGVFTAASASDQSVVGLFSGASYAVRLGTIASIGACIEGVDVTGSASYQPLVLGGTRVSFTINGAETTRINSSGNLQFTLADAGIVFNKTGALTNSTLNDYEVGTWTPTLASGTWNLRNATYTKIGRQVTVELWADTLSSTVNIINGLPFVANSYSPGVAHNNSGNAYVARAGASSTDVYLRNYADNAIALNSMGSFLIFTITYSTT